MKAVLRMALALCTVGCGVAMPSQTTSMEDPVSKEADSLRQEQVQLLWSFDTHLAAASAKCDDLCSHHTRICTLATRICEIAKAHPEHARARLSCESATATCRETNERLPEECWCRS